MCGGMSSRHHQPHHAAEAPLPHAFLDGLQQIFGFQFLDRDIGVARDVEGMRLHHLHAGKQRRQIGGDHLFQPDQLDALAAAACVSPSLATRSPAPVAAANRAP